MRLQLGGREIKTRHKVYKKKSSPSSRASNLFSRSQSEKKCREAQALLTKEITKVRPVVGMCIQLNELASKA